MEKCKRSEFLRAGYCMLDAMPAGEMSFLLSVVANEFQAKVLSLFKDPELANASAISIERYHEFEHIFNHSRIWEKNARVFSGRQAESIIGRLSIFKEIRSIFGPFQVMDVEGYGHPEIYWRLVRPGKDVVGPHKDSWFFELTNNIPVEQQRGIAKVWIPVITCPRKSGLAVWPGSHKKSLAYKAELRHGRLKPLLTDQIIGSMRKVGTRSGVPLMFHRELLHSGICHFHKHTRVSIEFAVKTNDPGL